MVIHPYFQLSIYGSNLNPSIAPGQPQDLAVSVLSSTSLHLSWAPPPVDQQHGEITRYVISVEEVETGRLWEHNTTGMSFTISNLHPYYHYKSKVAAFTIGLGVFTLPVTNRTNPDGRYTQ